MIRAIHEYSYGTYGAPRVHAELREGYGVHVGRKRVTRLMRAAGLKGAQKRRFVRTTVSDARDCCAGSGGSEFRRHTRPDVLWVADLTYVATLAGFLYLAVVIDAFSFEVLDLAMTDSSYANCEASAESGQDQFARRNPMSWQSNWPPGKRT
jgi:putative transposase